MANKNNLSDFIPDSLLQNPVPLHSHWDSLQRFVRVGAPLAVGAILAMIAGVALLDAHLDGAIAFLFFFMGLILLTFMVYAVFVFEDERVDKEWRRNVYSQQLTIIQIAITNLTIINKATTVNVGNGLQNQSQTNPLLNEGVYNNADNLLSQKRSPQLLYPQVDDEINGAYAVAQVIVNEAFASWRREGNKRAKIKPISFDAITKLIETGHPRWKKACELLDDCGALRNSLQSNWALVAKDEKEAIDLLDMLLTSQGYYRHMTNGEGVWRLALAQ